MTADTRRPLTMAEISWRRRSVVWLWHSGDKRRVADLWRQLQQDIAERGCESIAGAMREFQTRTGATLHLIAGDQTEPPVRYRPRSRPTPTPTRPDDGPRAA